MINTELKKSIFSSQVMPKIGIRPTIDGRREGIRESLENQTMALAKSVADLIEKELKYPNGMPFKCVIADKTIGGVFEAAEAEEKFKKEGVEVTITVTASWCYGSETMDMHPHRPKAVYGFNGTERPGAVYLAAVLAAHNQKGLPAFSIYGKDVQDENDIKIPEDVKRKIIQFARAGIAVALMRKKSYLSIGGVSMGIAGSMIDPDFLQDYLGMRTEYVDMTEIIRRIDRKIFDKEEYTKAVKWVKKYCKEGPDNNPKSIQRSREQKDSDWNTIIKMTLIMRDLMVGNSILSDMGFIEESFGHNAIAAGFQGQRHWTDHFPNGDFSETILNSSFDWNGLRGPYLIATENDYLNAVSMLFGYLLTNTAQIFADVRTYWSREAIEKATGHRLKGKIDNGIIHLINSGSAALDGTGQQMANGKPVIKPYWDISEKEVYDSLDNTVFYPANVQYFRGGGFSTNFLTKENMPVTMSRINIVKGLGPVLQIAEGHSVEMQNEIHKILEKRTDPTWPTTWFLPRLTGKGAFTNTYSVMYNWGANHAAVSCGHIGRDLLTLASILRIPVSMHNVEEVDIFRPSAWSSFGTHDLESADYRACKNFGPLYGYNK
jgi:L-fucose/D-arabinose isomerase